MPLTNHKPINWGLVLLEAQVGRKNVELLPIQLRLIRDMRGVFRKQELIFLDEFKRYRTEFTEVLAERDLDTIMVDVSIKTETEMAGAIMLAGSDAMALAAEHRIADFGVSVAFDLKNPRAVSYLANNAAEKVTKINETTKARMRTILTQATDEGWSYDKTAKDISSRWQEFRVGKPQLHIDSRAHLVAVTESAEAYEEGNIQVARQIADQGIIMEKSWLDSGDDRVSEGCRRNAGQGWIALEEAHLSGHMKPPRFPGCRCDELYRRKKEG